MLAKQWLPSSHRLEAIALQILTLGLLKASPSPPPPMVMVRGSIQPTAVRPGVLSARFPIRQLCYCEAPIGFASSRMVRMRPLVNMTFRAWDQTGATAGQQGTKVDTSTNGGTSAFSSATEVASITVTAINDIPIIAGLDGDVRAYTEDSAAVLLGSTTGITDVDSTDFNTGTLTVSFIAGSDSAEDVLGIRNEGTGAGQIGVSGANVTFGGVTIGTWTGGSSGSNLVIAFNANANATNAAALINNLTYLNTDNANPTTTTRNIRVVLTDGDGGTSVNNDTTMTVATANDNPLAITDTAAAVEAGGIANGTAGTNPTGTRGPMILDRNVDTDVDTGDHSHRCCCGYGWQCSR